MKVRWWAHTNDPAVASFRLRALQIVANLAGSGLDVGWYAPSDETPPAVLVLSKRYDPATLKHALALRERAGTLLVLDLCDNHLFFEGADPTLLARAQALREALRQANAVVASTNSLADVLRTACQPPEKVKVIGDAVELPFEPPFKVKASHPIDEATLWVFRNRLCDAGVAVGRRLLWFGNQGSPGVEGGISDLARIGDLLHRAHADKRLSVTIVSNGRDSYSRLIEGWRLPTFYLPWKAHTFSRIARLHGAALIPISANPFNVCKTNNRVATAFLHGLNVLADAIPSYAEFAGCAVLNDWPRGLGPYLEDAGQRSADVQRGREIVLSRYSLSVISAQWRAQLGDLAQAALQPTRASLV